MRANSFYSSHTLSIDGVLFRAGEWTQAWETDEIVKRAMSGLLSAKNALERISDLAAPPIIIQAAAGPLNPVLVHPTPAVVAPAVHGMFSAMFEPGPVVEAVVPVVADVPVVEVEVSVPVAVEDLPVVVAPKSKKVTRHAPK